MRYQDGDRNSLFSSAATAVGRRVLCTRQWSTMHMLPLYRCLEMRDNQTFLLRKHTRYSHPTERLPASASLPARTHRPSCVSLFETSNALFIIGNPPVILTLALDWKVSSSSCFALIVSARHSLRMLTMTCEGSSLTIILLPSCRVCMCEM